MCTGPGCAEGAEGCVQGSEGIGTGEGDADWIAGEEQLEELRRVNSS